MMRRRERPAAIRKMSSVCLARVEAGPRTAIKLEGKLAVENANRAAHGLGAGGGRECAHPRGQGYRPEEAMQKPWDPVQINTTDSLTPFARRL